MWWIALIVLLLIARQRGRQEPVVDKVVEIARAIARAEGGDKQGTLPWRLNNPGALKNPATGELRNFPTIEDGYRALYRQIRLILDGRSSFYRPTMTIQEIAMIYTGNDRPDAWANIVSDELGVSPDSRLIDVV